jgi:predicted SnoaL-like aldol condensation-catalyzing enzyme
MLSYTTILNRRTALHLGSGGIASALTRHDTRAMASPEATLETNKTVVRRVFEEVINAGNMATMGEVYAPEFVSRSRAARKMLRPAGMPLTLHQLQATWPEVWVDIAAIMAEDDLVAALVSWHGIPPSPGTDGVGQTLHLFRLAQGEIIAQWSRGWEELFPALMRSPLPANPLVVAPRGE